MGYELVREIRARGTIAAIPKDICQQRRIGADRVAHVWLYLAECADDSSGRAWPPVRTIVRITGIAQWNVQTAITVLVESALIIPAGKEGTQPMTRIPCSPPMPMRKRADREGTLFTTVIKGITYYVRRVRMPDGSLSKSLYGRTQEAAMAKGEAELKKAITTGRSPRARRSAPLTMGEFLRQYHEARRPPVIAATTWKAQNSKILEHLIPHIGDIPADKFSEDDIRRLQATLLRKPRSTRLPKDGSKPPTLSSTTVRDVRMILHAALESATGPGKRFAINPDDLKGVAAPKAAHTVRRQLDLAAARRLVRALRGMPEEALFLLYLGTAIRKSEGLGLMWSAVDLERATVTLERALHDVGQSLGGVILVDDVKNDSSRRTLYLPDFVVVALRRLRMRQDAERELACDQWHEQGLIFSTQFGTPLGPRNVSRSWYAALKRADLPHMRLQDVRGSVGSLLLEDGEDIGVISNMKGHASVQTTMKHYTQVRMIPKRRAADRLQRLLGDELVREQADEPIRFTPRRARRGG